MSRYKWIALTLTILVFNFASFSQKEKEINVKLGNDKIYGTLTAVKQKNAPIAIIIPGSGPTDRDGNNGPLAINTYKLLAEGLAQNGIASVRYDKLGIGKSKTELEEENMVFEDNTNQVLAIIEYLKKKKYDNIVLIGHSEGSLIGMLTVQKEKVSKFISIAGAGRTIDNILLEQLIDLPDVYFNEAEEILYQLKNGNKVEKTSPELAALFRESVQPYLISWLQLDPAEEIAKIDIPTLIIQGTTDIQISVDDAQLLKRGNKDAELRIIENLNHILKEATSNDKTENLKTYYNPKLPLHEKLISIIVDFIKQPH